MPDAHAQNDILKCAHFAYICDHITKRLAIFFKYILYKYISIDREFEIVLFSSLTKLLLFWYSQFIYVYGEMYYPMIQNTDLYVQPAEHFFETMFSL